MQKHISKLSLATAIISMMLAGSCSTSRANAGLQLVADGIAKAVIVTADTPSAAARQSALVLSDHLHQISGARVPIFNEQALQNPQVIENRVVATVGANRPEAFILVGESALAKQLGVTAAGLGAGGIRLRTVGNALVLLGAENQFPSDPNATSYAVTQFLEEQLGVRYLWPGELGKVLPHQRTISIPAIQVDYTPKIQRRRIRNGKFMPRYLVGLGYMGFTEADFQRMRAEAIATKSTSPDWLTWQHLGGSLGLVSGHAFGYAWEKYGKEHPEWFALQPNGSRDQSASPDRARLCVSNTELQDAIARDKIEELDRNPQQSSVSLDPNDGGLTTFCICPECKKLDPPEGRPIRLWDFSGPERKFFPYVSLTDRMVYFWNNVAERVQKKHPDALFGVRAYGVYSAPPLKRKLNPNIVVEQVSGDYLDATRTKEYLQEWEQWSKAARQLAWRPNIDANQRRHGLPTIYVHRMAQDIKARANAGMVSTDIDTMMENWATNGLNFYVLARLHWNPDLDVDALVADYCRSGFGEGAPFIQEYFKRIEEITYQAGEAANANREANAQGELTTAALVQRYDPSTLAELGKLLDQAQFAVGTNGTMQARVNFLRRGLSYTQVQAPAFRLLEKIKANDGKVADQQAVLSFMEQRYAVMRDIFQNETLAMDIPWLLWGNEGYFRPVQSKEAWAALASPAANKPVKQEMKTVIDADENGMPEVLVAPKAP